MDIQELKALAQDIKNWGDLNQAWADHDDAGAAVVGCISDDDDEYPVMVIDCGQSDCPDESIKLARFYAAANPKAVLELIALIENKGG